MRDEGEPTAADLDVEGVETTQNTMKRGRDPEAMDWAAKEVDEGREVTRRRLGEVDLAVGLIRNARDAGSTSRGS